MFSVAANARIKIKTPVPTRALALLLKPLLVVLGWAEGWPEDNWSDKYCPQSLLLVWMTVHMHTYFQESSLKGRDQVLECMWDHVTVHPHCVYVCGCGEGFSCMFWTRRNVKNLEFLRGKIQDLEHGFPQVTKTATQFNQHFLSLLVFVLIPVFTWICDPWFRCLSHVTKTEYLPCAGQ